ncbi:MAG: hypothetical protein K6E59_00900 [Bacilli bacterium]|nr:hypothetical protein [Bacilli bacterium]
MSYKLGLLLSIVFMMSVLLFSGDLINVGIIKNSLNSLALTVSYRIAKDGAVLGDTRTLVESYGAELTFEEGWRESFRIGDTVTFYLKKEYTPFVLRKGTMPLSVRRSAVIGYYKN